MKWWRRLLTVMVSPFIFLLWNSCAKQVVRYAVYTKTNEITVTNNFVEEVYISGDYEEMDLYDVEYMGPEEQLEYDSMYEDSGTNAIESEDSQTPVPAPVYRIVSKELESIRKNLLK